MEKEKFIRIYDRLQALLYHDSQYFKAVLDASKSIGKAPISMLGHHNDPLVFEFTQEQLAVELISKNYYDTMAKKNTKNDADAAKKAEEEFNNLDMEGKGQIVNEEKNI